MSKYTELSKNGNNTLKDSLGKKIYDYIPQGSVVLDVGCSSGYFGALLMDDKKALVDGIELNSEDATRASKVLRDVYSFDLEGDKWPILSAKVKYDVILFGDVLEHLRHPGEVLSRFSKLLKPKGVIIVSVPNIAHSSIRMELLQGNFEYEKLGILDDTHMKYFTFKSFYRLLNQSGYKVVDFDQSVMAQPRKTTESILASLGLIPTKKFYKFISRPDATAFQYKFVATPGKNRTIPRLPKKPLEIATLHIAEVNKLHDTIGYLSKELKIARGALTTRQKLPDSKIFKLARRAQHKIKGALKK